MRNIPDPGFAGDDGTVAHEVQAALRAYSEDRRGLHPRTLAVLQHSRVLVPVVAVLGELEAGDQNGDENGGENGGEYGAEDGLPREKTSDMAAVLTTGRDGRRALLAFTGSEPMRRWDPEARPVPVALPLAATAALQDDASALVVDVAGPVMFVVEADDLQALAEGYLLVEVRAAEGDGFGWAKPAR